MGTRAAGERGEPWFAVGKPLNARRSGMLSAVIPNSSVVEQMGPRRAPVGDWAPSSAAARAYRALWSEVRDRLLA